MLLSGAKGLDQLLYELFGTRVLGSGARQGRGLVVEPSPLSSLWGRPRPSIFHSNFPPKPRRVRTLCGSFCSPGWWSFCQPFPLRVLFKAPSLKRINSKGQIPALLPQTAWGCLLFFQGPQNSQDPGFRAFIQSKPCESSSDQFTLALSSYTISGM